MKEDCSNGPGTGASWFLPRPRKSVGNDRGDPSACSKAYPYNLHFGSQVINGVNFVSIDDANDDVTQDQVEAFAKEVKKGLPVILLMHVP